MSDLISRSALKKYLRDYKWEFAMGSDFSKAMEMIDAQPTAYDVDAVVKELEKQAEEHRDIGFDMESRGFSNIADNQYGKQIAYLKAIDIVKAGSVK